MLGTDGQYFNPDYQLTLNAECNQPGFFAVQTYIMGTIPQALVYNNFSCTPGLQI